MPSDMKSAQREEGQKMIAHAGKKNMARETLACEIVESYSYLPFNCLTN